MSNKEFDKNIRENYQDYYSEVDLDKTWAAIEPAVDAINKKDRKRRLLFWFSCSSSLIIGILLLSVCYFKIKNLSTQKEEISYIENKKEDKKSLLKFQKVTFDSSQKVTTNSIKEKNISKNAALEESKISEQVSISSKSIIPDLKTIATEQQQTSPTYNNINTKNSTKARTIFHADLFPDVSEKQLHKKETQQDMQKRTLTGKQTKTQLKPSNKSLVSDLQKNVTPHTLQVYPSKTTIAKTKDTNQGAALATLPQKYKRAFLPLTNKLKTLPLSHFVIIPDSLVQKEKSIFPFETKRLAEHSQPKQIFSSKKNLKFTLSLQNGVSIPLKKITAPQADATSLLLLRQKTESVREAINFGILFNTLHNSGFQLTSGLQYTRIAEKFDYTQQTSIIDTIPNGVYALYRNYHGNHSPILDTITNKKHLTRIVHHYNYHQLIDLAVLFGYQLKKGKWGMAIHTGVAINLKLSTSGKMLDEQESFIDIQTHEVPLFRPRLAPSIHVGISGKFHISEKWVINLTPSFRYFLDTFNHKDYPLRQHYNLIGLELGVGYKL